MKEGLVIKESKNYDKFNFEKLHEGFMKYLGDLQHSNHGFDIDIYKDTFDDAFYEE